MHGSVNILVHTVFHFSVIYSLDYLRVYKVSTGKWGSIYKTSKILICSMIGL